MDTLSAGVKGEHSYQSYLYSASCGKFLNTLLYLTLKKARSLEAFRSVPLYLDRRPPSPHLLTVCRADGTYASSSADPSTANCTASLP